MVEALKSLLEIYLDYLVHWRVGRIRPFKAVREESEREKEKGESSSVSVSADTSGQLLVPQIHRMPWCLPTV